MVQSDEIVGQENVKESGAIFIVIPYYNGSSAIEKTLYSIVQQTTNRTIHGIVVNDGSANEELLRLQEICLKFPSVTIYTKDNGGVASARNFGYQIASGQHGKYIMFLDQDDELYEHAIEDLCSYLDSHKELSAVYGHAFAVNSNSKLITGKPHQELRYRMTMSGMKFMDDNFGPLSRDYLLMDCCITSPGQAVSRITSLAEINGPFKEELPGVDDWDMWVRLSFKGKICGIDKPVLRYRLHDNNISNDTTKMRMSGLKLRISWFSFLGLVDKLKVLFFYTVRAYSRFHIPGHVDPDK